MTVVSGLGSTASSTGTQSKSDSTTLGKQDFLTLLVTQLQYQDPLNPADSTQFVSQLAQFSALEQMQNVNSNLETLQLYEQSINNSQAMNFIGKNVKVSGSVFEYTSGGGHEFSFNVDQEVAEVHIKIYDSQGVVVAQIDPGAMSAGEQTVSWDGTDINGDAVDSGTYTFRISAKDSDGNDMSKATYMKARVTGVGYHDGNTYLIAEDGTEIPYSMILGAEQVPEEESSLAASSSENTNESATKEVSS